MRYPVFLSKNSTIGVCAPSHGCSSPEAQLRLENAIRHFNALGHKVVLTDSVRLDKKARSASAKTRAKEFLELYYSDNIDAIISVGGGEFMCEILPYIDFDKLKKARPKLYQGFSDNTILTYTLNAISDVASVYGYNFPALGMAEWHSAMQTDYDFLCGKTLEINSLDRYQGKSYIGEGNELGSYNLSRKGEWKVLTRDKNVNMRGRLFGGCSDIFAFLCGTKYDFTERINEKYGKEGIIWFFESCDLTIPEQLRVMWQLREAGWLKCAVGVIFGRPRDKRRMFDINYRAANLAPLKELKIPVIIDADFGHVPPILPIYSGATAEVTVSGGKGKIKYILD